VASFRQLDPEEIIRTSATLRKRVGERFQKSSLERLAGEIESLSREAASVSREILKPNWPLRGMVLLGAIAMALILATAISKANVRPDLGGVSDFIQGTEAFAQNLAFAGATIYFLLSLEIRRKRNKVLEELHVLRSIAHIIDMHQLTKDPERILGPPTLSSPERKMTEVELTRYLDYCTEMLALVSKVAAIYVQDFHDAASIDAASDVEDLAVGLSRTIWQKIMILDRASNPENNRC
jgi:hypothetical protein